MSASHHPHSDPDHESAECATLMGGIVVDDLPHAQHVAQLALDLFQITWPLHGFGRGEAALLRRAALLHDAGVSVSYRGHHKESLHLIMQANMPDLTAEEQKEVACIGRYHRKSFPKKRHAVYGDLDRAARRRVSELGGILRLADAFDYGHDSGVTHLYGHVLSTPGKPVQVMIHAGHHIDNEALLDRVQEQALKKRDLFEHAFHCRVNIAFEREGAGESERALREMAQLLSSHNGHH
jgi:exopolyphosphatase/pppGpp-phosphohydrolase